MGVCVVTTDPAFQQLYGSESMDILVICHYGLYQDCSCSFVHGQVKALAALGHRVRVVIPTPWLKTGVDGKKTGKPLIVRTVDGAELYYVRYLSLSRYGEGGFNARRAAAAIERHRFALLRDFDPAFIHAHTLGFDSDVGAALKKRWGIPLAVTTHGSDTSLPFAANRLSDLRRWCDSADLVIAVSSALKNKLSSCNPTTPVHVLLNGFCLQHLPEPCAKIPHSFIQVGHLLEQKQFHVTLRGFAAYRENHPDATLTIVGQGPCRQALEELCQQLHLGSSVTFLGQIPNEQVLQRMSQTEFFVMPSIREGFGIVYLEAMACGCLTVGTMGEGIADLIEHGTNGFLVPPADPLAIAKVAESCVNDPALAETVVQNGQRDALALTWEANAEKLIRLIEETVL